MTVNDTESAGGEGKKRRQREGEKGGEREFGIGGIKKCEGGQKSPPHHHHHHHHRQLPPKWKAAMKELRFGGGVNIELANLWDSNLAPAHRHWNAVTRVSVCWNLAPPVNPEINPRVEKENTAQQTFSKKSLGSLSIPPRTPPNHLSSTLCSPSLSAPPRPLGLCVAEIAAGAWGPPRLLHAMTPAQEALRLVNQQLKACL
ncbi:unnamed protein product [Pleuronectes platessa]|uniref:Uncharacterized protein n=1 Tax=Pleuronectes platessa TaxID=8262 RepID=A0A9N7UF55_PLEPL|nr:unnamed protein product [Pleuronectes platessa]